jgi:hypothetical protein
MNGRGGKAVKEAAYRAKSIGHTYRDRIMIGHCSIADTVAGVFRQFCIKP